MAKKKSKRSAARALPTAKQIDKIRTRIVETSATNSLLIARQLPMPSIPPSAGLWRQLAGEFRSLPDLKHYSNQELWQAFCNFKGRASLAWSEMAFFKIEVCGYRHDGEAHLVRASIFRYQQATHQVDEDGRHRLPNAQMFVDAWGAAQSRWQWFVRHACEYAPLRVPGGAIEPWAIDTPSVENDARRSSSGYRQVAERDRIRIMSQTHALACELIAEDLAEKLASSRGNDSHVEWASSREATEESGLDAGTIRKRAKRCGWATRKTGQCWMYQRVDLYNAWPSKFAAPKFSQQS